MNTSDVIWAIRESASFLYWNAKLNDEELDYLKRSMILLREVVSLNDKQQSFKFNPLTKFQRKGTKFRK